jgi:hypothetical protein
MFRGPCVTQLLVSDRLARYAALCDALVDIQYADNIEESGPVASHGIPTRFKVLLVRGMCRFVPSRPK